MHPCTKVNGFLDPDLIADNFIRHFKAVCTDERNEVSSNLRTRRHNYVGAPFDNTYLVDAELVEQMIGNMHRGTAAGLDGLTAEHLIICHSPPPGKLGLPESTDVWLTLRASVRRRTEGDGELQCRC